MAFEGVVETLNQSTVSGWVSYSDGAEPLQPDIELRFHARGAITSPTIIQRGDGRVGFQFHLPAEFMQLKWQEFLNDFDAVIATMSPESRWRVPLYKSVLAPFDTDNRTTVLAARLREYKLQPSETGQLAAFTIAYNEPKMIPLWAKYYGDILGNKNLFIIDQGSEYNYREMVSSEINIITLPRELFDNWLIARIVAVFQRFLLESYDSVLYTDSDEFVCADPAILKGVALGDFLKRLPQTVGITTGFNLIHDVGREKPYDSSRTLLSQRRFLHRMPTMDKPLISRVPLNWIPGFHSAAEGGTKVPGLYMLHLRWFDLDYALAKGGFYRNSAWSEFDVENKLAEYQREGEGEIISRFRSLSANVANLHDSQFDPNATFTALPSWMREAIRV